MEMLTKQLDTQMGVWEEIQAGRKNVGVVSIEMTSKAKRLEWINRVNVSRKIRDPDGHALGHFSD